MKYQQKELSLINNHKINSLLFSSNITSSLTHSHKIKNKDHGINGYNYISRYKTYESKFYQIN